MNSKMLILLNNWLKLEKNHRPLCNSKHLSVQGGSEGNSYVQGNKRWQEQLMAKSQV